MAAYVEGGQPPPTQPRCSTLPFRIDEYAKALRGRPPSHQAHGLRRCKGQIGALDAYADRVRALVEGVYTVAVRDASSRHGFRFSRQALDRRTGIAFRGTRTWKVRLRAQVGFYLCASEGRRGSSMSFSVLAPG